MKILCTRHSLYINQPTPNMRVQRQRFITYIYFSDILFLYPPAPKLYIPFPTFTFLHEAIILPSDTYHLLIFPTLYRKFEHIFLEMKPRSLVPNFYIPVSNSPPLSSHLFCLFRPSARSLFLFSSCCFSIFSSTFSSSFQSLSSLTSLSLLIFFSLLLYLFLHFLFKLLRRQYALYARSPSQRESKR